MRTRVRNSQVAHQGFDRLRENITGRSWYDHVGQNTRSVDPVSPLCWTMHILAVQTLAFWGINQLGIKETQSYTPYLLDLQMAERFAGCQ